MQSSQGLNWLIILPAIITGGLAILGQILFTLWLSKKMRVHENSLSTDLKSYESALSHKLEIHKTELSKEIESYKQDLNRELENHKIQLQSDFQTQFYEFQTRYSLLHQKQAEAIQEMFSGLVEIQMQLPEALNLVQTGGAEIQRESRVKIFERCKETYEFYCKNRILFNDETRKIADLFFQELKEIQNLYGLAVTLESNHIYQHKNKPVSELKMEAHERSINQLKLLIDVLERHFSQLLSAETPSQQIQKINE